MFLQMWNINEKNPDNYAKYISNDINNLCKIHWIYYAIMDDSPLDKNM